MKTNHGHRMTSVAVACLVAAMLAGQFCTQSTASESESPAAKKIGLGAPAPEGADVLIDGTRALLDKKWTYWKGPRFSSSLPIKWKLVDDPVDRGKALMASDPAAAGGLYGAADIVTKKKYRDFRLHIEFLVPNKGGNSGVYLQNRYEIQVLDGDEGKHGMAAVINEAAGPVSRRASLTHPESPGVTRQ